MTKEKMKALVDKAILMNYNAPNGVTHEEIVEYTINLGIECERDRCRRIANHYEKGGEEQAKVAGTIRQQIEQGI